MPIKKGVYRIGGIFMKKSLLSLIFILNISNIFALIHIETKGGLGFVDKYSLSGSNYNGRLSYLFGLEALYESSEKTEVGIGVGYKYNSPAKGLLYSASSDSMHLFNTFPIYGVVKYKFPPMGEYLPFAKVYVGMGYNTIGEYNWAQSVESGLYSGIGLGADYGNVVGDLTYSLQQNQMSFVNPDNNYQVEKKSVSHSSVNFTIGYRFEFPWFK